jgi:hypothetical protein
MKARMEQYGEKYLQWVEKLAKREIIDPLDASKFLGETATLAKELDMERVTRLAFVSSFYDVLIRAYPHEDIGRYPTEIDGESSVNIYEKRKEHVWNLIQEIKSACSRIEESIKSE